MRYGLLNIGIFLLSVLAGMLVYILVAGAAAGMLAAREPPAIDSVLWPGLLVGLPLLCDAFLALAFPVPVGGLIANLIPSKRARMLARHAQRGR